LPLLRYVSYRVVPLSCCFDRPKSYPLLAYLLSNPSLGTGDRRTLLGGADSTHIKAEWETKFCDVLANSPWPELNGAHDCSIEMDNGNDHNPVADFLAAHSA
jgi:hypothetical protein